MAQDKLERLLSHADFLSLGPGRPRQDRPGRHRALTAALASLGPAGGEVLLSQATRELVHQELPGGVELRPLGEHKLKDIPFAQAIYQLDIDGLPVHFPPLKTRAGDQAPPFAATTLSRIIMRRRLLKLWGAPNASLE